MSKVLGVDFPSTAPEPPVPGRCRVFLVHLNHYCHMPARSKWGTCDKFRSHVSAGRRGDYIYDSGRRNPKKWIDAEPPKFKRFVYSERSTMSEKPDLPRWFVVVCDGGTVGEHGRGELYGSYLVQHETGEILDERRAYMIGGAGTSNEAEYLVLIGALSALIEACELDQMPLSDVGAEAWSDSKLMVGQMGGLSKRPWKLKAPNLKPLNKEANDLASRLGSFRIGWHPRSRSEAIFGH